MVASASLGSRTGFLKCTSRLIRPPCPAPAASAPFLESGREKAAKVVEDANLTRISHEFGGRLGAAADSRGVQGQVRHRRGSVRLGVPPDPH